MGFVHVTHFGVMVLLIAMLALLAASCSRPPYDWGRLSQGIEEVKR